MTSTALLSTVTTAYLVVESNLVKQALESEFPKLLRLLSDLWGRLNQAVTSSTSEVPLAMSLDGSQVDDLTPQTFE